MSIYIQNRNESVNENELNFKDVQKIEFHWYTLETF